MSLKTGVALAAIIASYGVSHVYAQTPTADAHVTVTAQNNAAPPVELFGRLPAKLQVRISPDGKHMAWIDGTELVIYDMVTGEEHRLNSGKNVASRLQWAGNDYVLLTVTSQQQYAYIDTDIVFGAPLIIDTKAKYVGPLFSDDSGKPSPIQDVLKIVDGENPTAFIVGSDKAQIRPGMSNSGGSRYVDAIYQVDLKTGKRKLLERGKQDTAYWSLDKNGVARVRVESFKGEVNYGSTRVAASVKVTPTSDWQPLSVQSKDNTRASDFTYSDSDNSVFWQEYNTKTNRSEVYQQNLDTGKTELFDAIDGPDITVLINAKEGKRIGVSYYTDRQYTKYSDPFYAKVTGAVQRAFPGQDATITSYTDDKSLLVVALSSGSHPTSYYLYDSVAKTVEPIGSAYPELEAYKLADVEYITYTASDGTKIPAYVTKRSDVKASAPMVLVVHGGPAGRDYYRFDWWTQMLASRGYVVLQPQFRGSNGFGDAFQKAGDKQWGRKMNTDLLDGVNYMVSQGIVDPKRVCITGWSYGGYATMAAVSLTPQAYKCAMAGAGVANPVSMINWVDRREGGQTGNENSSAVYWKSVMGDPRFEGKELREISPVAHADQVTAPLLLVHGDKDLIVPIEQSKEMYAAMTKAGKTVKMVTLLGEDHNITFQNTRTQFLKELDEWIAKYINDPK